jgi:hypothetical protein
VWYRSPVSLGWSIAWEKSTGFAGFCVAFVRWGAAGAVSRVVMQRISLQHGLQCRALLLRSHEAISSSAQTPCLPWTPPMPFVRILHCRCITGGSR